MVLGPDTSKRLTNKTEQEAISTTEPAGVKQGRARRHISAGNEVCRDKKAGWVPFPG